MSSEEHRNYFSRRDDFLQDGKMSPYFLKVFLIQTLAITGKQETKETSWSPTQGKRLS